MKTVTIAIIFISALSLNFADAQAASAKENRKTLSGKKDAKEQFAFDINELVELEKTLIITYLRDNFQEDSVNQSILIYDPEGQLIYEGAAEDCLEIAEPQCNFLFELNSVDYYISEKE